MLPRLQLGHRDQFWAPEDRMRMGRSAVEATKMIRRLECRSHVQSGKWGGPGVGSLYFSSVMEGGGEDGARLILVGQSNSRIIFSVCKCCIIPLIKIAQVSTVLLVLFLGLLTLWYHSW